MSMANSHTSLWVGVNEVQATKQRLAQLVILGSLLFNFVLCFANTKLFDIGANHVIAVEVALIAVAFSLIWNRNERLYIILFLIVAYGFLLMALRADSDPKFIRDLVIPVLFFFVGRHIGTYRSADAVLTAAIVIVLTVSLFEWFALDTYLHYFNVLDYYVARGTVTGAAADITESGLYISGTRFEPRTLLPILGEHRASGVFLEPVSVGNFGAIAFAWVWLRDKQRLGALLLKTLAIAAILALGDARFGAYLCCITIVIYVAAPLVRPTLLFIAPLVVMIALAAYASDGTQDAWQNTAEGRIQLAGKFLTALTPAQIFGLEDSSVDMADSGYAYSLVQFGVLGMLALWAVFAYAPVRDAAGLRFKAFVSFYVVFLLAISTSLFTIKTAALLWFLYGTTVNPARYSNAPPERAFRPH
jgi:putative polymerase